MSFHHCNHCGKVRKQRNIKMMILRDVITKTRELSNKVSEIDDEADHFKKSVDFTNIYNNIDNIINESLKIIKEM